jgi:hypothetical protein
MAMLPKGDELTDSKGFAAGSVMNPFQKGVDAPIGAYV